MIFGPNRLPLIEFFRAQAAESLLHANLAGEHITGLDGHPPLNIDNIHEFFSSNVLKTQVSINHDARFSMYFQERLKKDYEK